MAYMIVDGDKLDAKLSDLADKIRSKNRTTEGLDFFKGDFSEAVDNITGHKEEQEKTLTVTENGTYEVVPDAEKALSKVGVDVVVPLRYDEGYSAGYSKGYEASQDSITLQEKTVTENGEITFDEGYTGLSKVTVNVPERKEEQTKALEIVENGSYDILPDEGKVLSSASVNVNVKDKELAEIESLIDESGVLDNTEGTATEKVGALVEKIDKLNLLKKEVTAIGFTNNSGISTISLDCSNIQILRNAFNACRALRSVYLTNTGKVYDWVGFISASQGVYTVETLDFSSATNISQDVWNNWLENLKIVPETIKCNFVIGMRTLTDESIQSIVNGLATVETQKTVKFHSEVVQKLTDEQLITIANKNFTVG